jgi:hypothetical protein
MNEPKKRGRPPKAKSLDALVSQITPENTHAPAFEVSAAQAYARRVWEGQSISLPRHERLGRVAEALKAQGLSMEGVELP